MASNKYIKFLDEHRIEDNLLREFLHKEKLSAADDQITHAIGVYEEKILRCRELSELIKSEGYFDEDRIVLE